MDKVTKKSKVKDWYVNAYKSDSLGLEINPKVTFSKIMSDMRNGKDFYKTIGVGDSIIRERMFVALSELYTNEDYGEIYNLWLNGKDNVSVHKCCVGNSKKVR